MIRAAIIIASLLFAGAGMSPSSEGDQAARLARALAAFDSAVAEKARSGAEAQKLYRESLAEFTALLDEGVRTGALHYNIGNTYVRLGDVGRAIAHYRRALRLDPGDEAARKNLEVARKMCEAKIAKPATSAFLETLLFWHFDTSIAARLRFTLATYTLFWAIMLLMLLTPRRIPGLTWTAVVFAVLGLVGMASVGWDKAAAANRVEGVITADRVTLRKGNGEYYDPQFDRPLPAGVEFRVLESRQDVQGSPWYHVELPDKKDGWLRADQADII